jgi:hypothetical protein
MNGFRVTIDGKAVDCETRSFDYVRFEREFGIPFSSVAFEASRGEMRLEHLFWLAFCAWQRTTGHPKMDEWRDSLKGGITYKHPGTGLLVCGGVDDVWVNSAGELIIADYKATSKDQKITALDQDWHDGYKKQMEVYQWLFRKNDFKVSDTGYFVYANASKDREAFDGQLEFDVTLVPHVGDTSWVEPTLHELNACAKDDRIPEPKADCDYCRYREAAGKALLKATSGSHAKEPVSLGKKIASKEKTKTSEPESQEALF